MKKVNLFLLLLLATMMMPALVQAAKIKYGKGLVYEGNLPGEGVLTCGSLTISGNLDEGMDKSKDNFTVKESRSLRKIVFVLLRLQRFEYDYMSPLGKVDSIMNKEEFL